MTSRLPLSLFLLGAVACGAAPTPAPHATPPTVHAATPAEGALGTRVAERPPPLPAFGPDRDKALAEALPKIGSEVDDFFATEKPPSLVVAMIVDGRVVFTRVLGYRDPQTKTAPTPQTLYRIGSITKTFTANTVLALRDAGLVRLDDPAETYLPELAKVEYPTRDAPRITLRHLLTHSSGLPRLGDFDYTKPDKDVSEAELVSAIERAKLVRAPGTDYEYSNFGMSIVGLLVSRVAPEKSLRAAVAKYVTTPLDMKSTTFAPEANAEVATGFAKKTDTKSATLWRLGVSEGAGGLWSSLDDMAKYVAWELAAWPPRADADASSISRATRRESQVPEFPLSLSANAEDGHTHAVASAIGLAWHTRESCTFAGLVEHSGAIDGFQSAVTFAPDRGFGFVMLASALDTPLGKLQDKLLGAAKTLAPRKAQPAPELTEALARLVSSMSACDEKTYDDLFAAKFRSAVPYAQYSGICRSLTTSHGACTIDKTIELDGPSAGTFLLKCEKGAIEAHAVVADQKLTGLVVKSTGFAPSKELLAAAENVLALEMKWDAGRYAATFADSSAAAVRERAMATMRTEDGACHLAPDAAKTTGADGAGNAQLPIVCERGARLELEIATDEKNKVKSVNFRPRHVGGQRCTDPEPLKGPKG